MPHQQTEEENALAIQISETKDLLELILEQHSRLLANPPTTTSDPEARTFAAADAVQAAAGRLEDALAIIEGRTHPSDNDQPFRDLPSLELYRPARITAALMSMLQDHHAHPASYEEHAEAALKHLPGLQDKIETAMANHCPSTLLTEALYDDAAEMASTVRDSLAPNELSLLQLCAQKADSDR